MKDKILVQEKNDLTKIKVRLDSKTLMVINDISALDLWKTKYPDAKVIG